MFSCLWHLWDWLDPTSMENKKGTSNNIVNESQHEPIPKHSHQHNTAPQHLRLLQYGLKIPNHQHSQINQPRQLNSPNVHLHLHQPHYQSTGHRYLQPSPQQQFISPNSHQNHQNQYVHQHQQKPIPNQPIYHTNPPPPPLHPHNPLNQHNPQIWVPHQPPVHYHQPKLDAQPQKLSTNPTQATKPKEVLERKKSACNTNQHLRSPVAKRPPEAPVTMQGWLHKQGSEGLMLWKKRWFVLSDYCLFYYKGPEEEKLLGSVLLPSYKVSMCGPEDKVNRKYAFKCEHANMRTYILAADSQELMMQWVRVLNLACLLQNNVDLDQQSAQSTSTYIQSGENSDSGFHQQYNQAQTLRNTPVHMHTSSNTTDLSNPSQQELSQYNQPLYANAPPKPRRLNDGGYSSPSPDILDRYQPEPKYISPQPQHPYNLQPVHIIRNLAKSPVNLYNPNIHHQPEYISQVSQQPVNSKHHISDYVSNICEHSVPQNVERRTPDTYGRSKSNPAKGRAPSDYEDVYADQHMYKRPLSPLAYSNVKKVTPVITPLHRTYTPVSMLGPRDIVQYVPVQQLRKSPSNIPRPHSADFLEYEVAHRQANPNIVNRQQRPKSSLDINRNTSNDNYFYTEERYAEKMRKSAQYLPKMPRLPPQQEYAQQKRPSESDKMFPLMKSSTQPINFNNSVIDYSRSDPQPVRSRSVLSEGSLSKELEVDLRSSPHGHRDRGALSPAPLPRQEEMYGYSDDVRRREYDQFTRSASARLSQNTQSDHIPFDGRINREGERKREESMKRLLEWKQRMLQSPLNRKVHQNMNKIFMGKPDVYYKHPENGYIQKMHADAYLDGRSTSTMPQYNSYSSDDEENEERSKENVKTQAGWTVDTLSSESFSPAHSTSTTVFNTPPDETLPSSDNPHAIKDTCTSENMPVEKDVPETDDTFTKPLKLFNKEAPHIAHVSSLRSEFSEKFEQSPVITEIKSNGALVKSILAEFERNSEESKINPEERGTPTRDVDSVIEENYMTMTPKKNILGPSTVTHDAVVRVLNMESDENPYVEMTQGCDMSLLNPEASTGISEQQPYETICFSGGKMEPVYMELSQPQGKTELPDILMPSQSKKCKSNKSDSSDADDEASKDLDSLDTPSHPRFSLSDTFRPASYYLGASQAVPELQDSSDSELVSPPPIPRSPPPLDELDECTSSNQDYSLTEHTKKDDDYRYKNRNSDQYFNSINKFSKHKKDGKKRSALSLTNLKDTDSLSLCSINTEGELRYGTTEGDQRYGTTEVEQRYGSTEVEQRYGSTEVEQRYGSTEVEQRYGTTEVEQRYGSTEGDQRYCSRLSHNSDSDVELRTHVSRSVDYERMLKRRPVSEEFCGELELDNNFNETIDSADLDKYLTDLQVSNLSAASNEISVRNYMNSSSSHDYENLCIMERGTDILHSRNKESTGAPQGSGTPVGRCAHSHSRENSREDAQSSIITLHSDLAEPGSLLSDFVHRSRPDSSTSITTEINGFLHNSRRSTPSVRAESSMSTQEIYFHEAKHNQAFNQGAPYYYSDLSMNTSHTDSTSTILTLNNQRSSMIGSKRDITHIVNPIRCNTRSRNSGRNPRQNLIENTFKLAAEARSVSVDFLNLTDKSGQIDKKNIYESDTLKRLKAMDSITSLQSNPETRNLYPILTNEKFNDLSTVESNVRRTHSLEGLLENVLSETTETTSMQDSSTVIARSEVMETDGYIVSITEGSYLWEEDSIWHERLRSASQRHTKSLDDLDSIGEVKREKCKKQPRGITRCVTYVNDNIYNMPIHDKQQKDVENKKQVDNSREKNKEISFIIDREKLRQWDLLSSAPSDAQIMVQCTQGVRVNNMVVDMGDEVTGSHTPEQSNIQEQASGSICVSTRDTFPRAISSKRIWTPNSQSMQSRSSTNLARGHEGDYSLSDRQAYYMSQVPSHHDISSDTMQSNASRKGNWQWGGRMNVSAGELLGRTHEELVLLLIQLRRQSTNTCNAIEACYNEIENTQAQLHLMDASKRLENIQKLEQIKQHLLELEKQYEKGKPLVNLVDNMVKLGSLYRSPNDRMLHPYVRDRLEFNQQIQERRLLAEERRDWNRLNPNHTQLQEKVQQLYQLDRLIQEESGTLQGLQQDKEDIERALGGLRHRLNKGYNDPAEIEQARKQQAILENELSRVHLMLAQNSKKLEETVAGNARLEQELLVLKQKLQISRQQRSSPQFSNAGDSLPCVVGTSAMLESDLQRVQQKVGDLQRQRQELSMQVRQLTDRSNNLQHQFKPYSTNSSVNNQGLGNKKKMQSVWRETDLDTMNIIDHGEWENAAPSTPTTPLYINTDLKQSADSDFYNRGLKSSDSTSEDTMPSSNFMPQEKPEIKTVRIVKRESERRQRDREKTCTGKWDPLLEEDTTSSQSSSVLFRPTSVHQTQSTTNIGALSPNFMDADKANSDILSRQSSLSSPSLPQGFSDLRTTSSNEGSMDKSPELSPVFKSEAAKQIITEMSTQETPKQLNRRAVPKEKRRHYTAPNNNLIMKSLNQLPTDENTFDKISSRRARDDLDMERALRQRIDAPDVVRSTLSSKELKYNENTIDNLLGTPNKINIPERYIPEQVPQLSAEEQEHRLRKVESIKKMLSDTTIISSSSANLNAVIDDINSENSPSPIVNKATTKMIEEKKQREHLLQLNQILAKQVMEMSKIVAVKALAKLPLEPQKLSTDEEEEDLSPETPLPLYQQRDNFYS